MAVARLTAHPALRAGAVVPTALTTVKQATTRDNMSSSIMPVTKSDAKLAKKHLKDTIKLEKKKVKDHLKAYKKATDPESKAYNLAHAKGHKKDIKARQKYAKKVGKVRGK